VFLWTFFYEVILAWITLFDVGVQKEMYMISCYLAGFIAAGCCTITSWTVCSRYRPTEVQTSAWTQGSVLLVLNCCLIWNAFAVNLFLAANVSYVRLPAAKFYMTRKPSVTLPAPARIELGSHMKVLCAGQWLQLQSIPMKLKWISFTQNVTPQRFTVVGTVASRERILSVVL
jgi:hypothetical protein